MSEYQLGYLVGVVVGVILFGAIFIFAIRHSRKDRSVKCRYDERQLQKRGNAFKIAFFTLLLENAACLFLFTAFSDGDLALIQKTPITPSSCLFFMICVACAVFAGYCIWNDCYLSLNENGKPFMVIFGVTTLINIIMAVRHLIEGDFMEDGVLGTPFNSLICGIMLLFIFFMLLAKRFCQKKDEE